MEELSAQTIDAIATAVKEKLSSSPDPASLLGSASEIWVLIVLIIPGFIAFKIIDWIIQTGKDFNQFQATLYSLALSLGIFFVVASLTNASNPDSPFESLEQIRSSATVPLFVAKMFGFGVLFGVVGGAIVKIIFMKNFTRNAWDRFADRYLEDWVIVYVQEGDNEVCYSGWLKNISTGKEKRDLILKEPAKMICEQWNRDGLGPEMYFTEDVIRKIDTFPNDQ